MLLYLRLLRESLAFAMNALINNKLRTFLSLLGVTIGIFSIIAVLAAVDSLDRKIRKDLSKVDENTMYLKRFSFGPTDIPRWKREQFPDVTFDEYQYLKDAVPMAEYMAFQIFTKSEIVKYEDKSVNNINMVPVSYEFADIQSLDIKDGRFYNEAESNSGKAVAVIGHEVAENLFGGQNPIDKKIRIYGQRFTVIGVIEKQGESTFGPSNDITIIIPVNFVRRMYGDNNSFMTPVIVIKPQPDAEPDAVMADITQKLRSYRGIKAGDISNFMIDILAGFTDLIDDIIGQMNMIGWIISAFSLLVGGFGIANIMFVSVKERTNLIGIQKALGAKNRFILFQFLFEAVILSVIGGIVGMLMVWGIAEILTKALDFEFILGFWNVVIGTGLAVAIGLASGILPAIAAAKLDPVEAIRTGM
ncbi:FtsX-like permease family protein [Flavobacterium salilacus subsp. salilacus]|uniref:ABC transporter permease n=1 Tax=Flavobacterium TaxID=237 RepID=UPI00107535D7|nr:MULTISPECIES: ABC transporter permease [Flavobacterium]KAF2519953.1 FtsX-like permease family protein [Flavobacterium salilacus subsp. salilacus]MBE1614136.1 ABC transporter permease [Flavobacterium sp. SaA2.13]